MIRKIYRYVVPERTRIEIIYFVNKILSPVYYGKKYYCNCCNKSFRKFLSKGNVKRLNAKCPYCGSLERVRLLHLYLKNETLLFSRHLKVLHIAPEKCLFNIFRRLDIEYIDGDINPAYARNVIDITDIQYPDEYFDLIICSHVLGHIPDESGAISELRRVLKKDGIAIIMTLINSDSATTIEDSAVISPGQRLSKYGEPDLCRLHGLDFSLRLEKQGFAVECIDYRKELPVEVTTLQCLGDGSRELIYRCVKLKIGAINK